MTKSNLNVSIRNIEKLHFKMRGKEFKNLLNKASLRPEKKNLDKDEKDYTKIVTFTSRSFGKKNYSS